MSKSKLEWLICRDPVHIGGADSDSRGNRNPIYRLPDGTPVIPGSSLRGALREHTSQHSRYQDYEEKWFGSDNKNNEGNNNNEETKMVAGTISLGWAFPLWFPVHVMGYGNWWITCPGWLNRFWQLQGHSEGTFYTEEDVYSPNEKLTGKSVYFRWLKLTKIQHYSDSEPKLPLKGLNKKTVGFDLTKDKCLIVPDDKVNLFVEMGLVRQPRVSLRTPEEAEQSDDGSLVDNLFSIEGLPPRAVFFFAWTTRNIQERKSESTTDVNEAKTATSQKNNLTHWENFLRSEHYVGGLWSIGYGRVSILAIPELRN